MQISYTNSKTPPKMIIKYGTRNSETSQNLPLSSSETIDVYITYINGVLNVTNNGSAIYTNRSMSINISDMSIYLGYTLSSTGNVLRPASGTIYEFYVREITD